MTRAGSAVGAGPRPTADTGPRPTADTGPRPTADTGLDVVTGAFSYSGASLSRALQDAGRTVRTLTGHPGRAPAGTPVDVRPLDFDDHLGLVASLSGATTLYNTF